MWFTLLEILMLYKYACMKQVTYGAWLEMTLVGLSTSKVTVCVRFNAVYVYGWFLIQKLNLAYVKYETDVENLNVQSVQRKVHVMRQM